MQVVLIFQARSSSMCYEIVELSNLRCELVSGLFDMGACV